MRITTKGRYALRAVLYILMHEDELPISIKRISEEEEISPIFLEQIFTRLKKSGIVRSIRGAGGGFVLDREASDVSIRDILNSLEESVCLSPCVSVEEGKCNSSELNCPKENDCLAGNFWGDLNTYIDSYLGTISLADIISKYGNVNNMEEVF